MPEPKVVVNDLGDGTAEDRWSPSTTNEVGLRAMIGGAFADSPLEFDTLCTIARHLDGCGVLADSRAVRKALISITGDLSDATDQHAETRGHADPGVEYWYRRVRTVRELLAIIYGDSGDVTFKPHPVKSFVYDGSFPLDFLEAGEAVCAAGEGRCTIVMGNKVVLVNIGDTVTRDSAGQVSTDAREVRDVRFGEALGGTTVAVQRDDGRWECECGAIRKTDIDLHLHRQHACPMRPVDGNHAARAVLAALAARYGWSLVASPGSEEDAVAPIHETVADQILQALETARD